MVRVEIDYKGKTYSSKELDWEEDFEKFVDRIYDNVDSMKSMKLELQDGSWLVLGKCIQDCVIRVIPCS